jgi:hypothetical protein
MKKNFFSMESNLKPSRKWDKTFKKVGQNLQGSGALSSRKYSPKAKV